MGWLDNLYRRGEQATRRGEPAPPTRAITPVTAVTHVRPDRGEASPRPKPKLEFVWIHTAAPRNGDSGAAEIGFYTVEDGVVVMRNEDGKATGAKQALGPDDNPKIIAGRLRRAAWSKAMGEGNFNRPLSYRQVGIA